MPSRTLGPFGFQWEPGNAALVWAAPPGWGRLSGLGLEVTWGPPTWWLPRLYGLQSRDGRWHYATVGWLRGALRFGVALRRPHPALPPHATARTSQ